MDGQQYHQSVFRAQPSDGAQRKIQKRNRPPVSCLLCRTRKVKCDRQQPCERCVKSGEAAFCEYAPRAARKPRSESRPQPDNRPKHEAVSRPVLQVRLQKLEEMVSGLVHNTENALDTPSSLDQRTDGESRSDLSTPPSIIGANHSGILTTQSDTTFVGATHWASILESINDIRGIIEADTDEGPSPSPPASGPHDIDVVFGPQAPINMEQAVARLPPKNKTDQLVLIYFRHRFTAAPYIHTSKFQREYDGFWRDPSSVSLLWVSILASILLVASYLASVKGEDLSKDCEAAHPDNFSKLAVECLVAGDYLAAKPYSIEALLLQAFTELQRNKDCPSQVWAKFGLLVRLAQRMGYHRDPKYLPNITPFEGELRRRAWFFIEVFDCLFSFQLGMPPSIREDECDTESPGNLFDLDFDENSMMLPPPRPATEPTSTLYLCIKSKLCRLLRRVIRLASGIQPPSYEEVRRLHDDIERYHDQIPTPLRIRPIRSYSFTDHTHDIVHRVTLEMMYLKSLCVLHRKYLNSEKDDHRYDMSRRTSVNAAIRILDLHAEYEEECRPGGRLYEDRYMLASLSLHDFLIASMIICLDLTENAPFSPEDRARKLKALGTSYKIWSERKNVSKDSAHATRVVGAILRKVSSQEPVKAAAVPPLPQPDIRDGSLASLLNNDTQLPPMATMATMAPMDQSQLVNAMDFSLDFIDPAPLDSVLDGIGNYDWTMIDQYLLDNQ
ncbi:putative Fungal-specific transcription factor domain-containing protein [Seiridium cardinale]|uniref:Fungal-specific transcription factor domain-containing protein n=1 Tax=Seiridium cardinale TaxID=138064 RepID=A0ABR2Y8B2_9PEZI